MMNIVNHVMVYVLAACLNPKRNDNIYSRDIMLNVVFLLFNSTRRHDVLPMHCDCTFPDGGWSHEKDPRSRLCKPLICGEFVGI